MTTNTDRTDLTAGIYGVLAGYVVTNPSRLQRAYSARPMGPSIDLPCAWVDNVTERVGHDVGTRTRTLTASVVLLRANSDNPEVAAAFALTVDDLTELFTAHPQFIAGSMSSEWSVENIEDDFGGLLFPGVRFTFPTITVQVGRN